MRVYRERTSEQNLSARNVALGKQFADVRTGNDLSADLERLADLNGEAEITAVLCERMHVAFRVMAEMEVIALVDFLGLERAGDDVAGEIARRKYRKVTCEGKQEQSVDARGFEQLNFEFQGRDEFRSILWAQYARRMRLEGHGYRLVSALLRA